MEQTEAEKEAWAISKREGLDLVTINPTFVLGPVVSSRTDATSIILFKVQLLPCLRKSVVIARWAGSCLQTAVLLAECLC